MISLKNIVIRRGPHVLLKEVNWTIYFKQRIGIIGANGAGKTSLFAMLLGELEADLGKLDIPSGLKLAAVAQETPAYSCSALEFVLQGDEELCQLNNDLKIAEEMNDGLAIAHIHTRMSEIDAYSAEARAAQLLDGLGFSFSEQHQSVSDFSGGWRVRLNLAKALMCRSDVLLLDEPTNHLDLDAVIWLQNWLRNFQGTLLLISHDREFLDDVVNHIAHISNQQLKVYSGNYSSFEKQRAEQLLLQQAAYEKQQKHIAHMQSFINRFRAKASKARQAQSRMKAIERLELVDAVHTEADFNFAFKPPKKCPNPLINLNHAYLAYGEKLVLKDLNLSITPKDRIALLGPNGAGKSSLIKLLAGEITPASGERINGDGLKIGYFAQHQIDHLDMNESPLAHFKKIATEVREQELRTFLGSFGFVGNRVMEKVNHFSGGEKSRLALALLIWQQPNLLLLDEPTNHLDLDMRHALSLALQEYQGAMMIVSHDRFLLQTTVDQLMLVVNNVVTDFQGDLQDYEKWLLAFRKEEKKALNKKTEVIESTPLEAKEKMFHKNLMQQIKKCEDKITKLEEQLQQLELKLANNTLYEKDQHATLQRYLQEQTEVQKLLEQAEMEWLQISEKLKIHPDLK